MSSFHERQKNLFNLLKDAEDQHGFSTTNKVTDAPDYGVIDQRSYKRLKHEMKQFRGKESIFKKHDANIRQCLRAKTVPDHVKNPKKYVYYSLADVTPDQMSDATNTATALSLIRQLEDQEAAKLQMDHDDDDTIFKKPTFRVSSTVKKSSVQDEKTVFKNNKIIMPEYVVGVSQKKEKKPNRRTSQEGTSDSKEKKTQLKLNHLYNDDDTEEET